MTAEDDLHDERMMDTMEHRLSRRMLSESDVTEIRALLEHRRASKMLWETLRGVSLWISAVVAGLTLGFDRIRELIKWLAS